MSDFKVIIGDPETGKCYKKDFGEKSEEIRRNLLGMRIGETFDGELIGFDKYKFKITGGSDSEGFAMHPSVQGSGRKKILSRRGIGFRIKRKGIRLRKSVRGNTVSEAISALNIKIIEKGPDPIEKFL